jgi:hypothetical protein
MLLNLISTFLKQASMLILYPKKMAHMSAFDAISNKALAHAIAITVKNWLDTRYCAQPF